MVAAGGVEVTTRDAAVAGVGLLIGIGGSAAWALVTTKRPSAAGFGSDAGGAKDAYDLISRKKPGKNKTTGGSDHYFKTGVERQSVMSTAADQDLDDYIEETGEIKDEPLLKDLFVQDEY